MHSKVKVLVAPLLSGAGVKGKVLSAFTLGVPVVGTDIAFEGMEVQSSSHCLIASTGHSFAAAVELLVSDCEVWSEISKNALSFVSENFGWSSGRDGLERVLTPLKLDSHEKFCQYRGTKQLVDISVIAQSCWNSLFS